MPTFKVHETGPPSIHFHGPMQNIKPLTIASTKSVLQSNFATALSAQVLFAFKLAFSADLNHNRLTNLNYGRDCVGA